MADMANITVKNAANVDVVFVKKTPSAGDKSPARWTADAASPIANFRPAFSLVTRDNARGNGRVFQASYSGPITATVDGVETLLATEPLTCSGTLPTNVDSAKVNDHYVLFSNLLVAALIRQAMSEGHAPS